MPSPRIGINWPTPGPENSPPDLDHFKLIRDTGFEILRFNLDCRRTDSLEWISAVRAAGLQPLPILDGDRDHIDIPCLVELASWIDVPVLEIFNEPSILSPRIPGDFYVDVFKAVRKARPDLILALSAEATIPVAKPLAYYDRVISQLSPKDWDIWSVHPYRNPRGPRTSRFLWDRHKEHRWYERKALGKPIWWTETGWSLNKNSEAEQAKFVRGELEVAQQLGVEVVIFYAMVEDPRNRHEYDFGFWRQDWSPRPVVDEIRKWTSAVRAIDEPQTRR